MSFDFRVLAGSESLSLKSSQTLERHQASGLVEGRVHSPWPDTLEKPRTVASKVEIFLSQSAQHSVAFLESSFPSCPRVTPTGRAMSAPRTGNDMSPAAFRIQGWCQICWLRHRHRRTDHSGTSKPVSRGSFDRPGGQVTLVS